MTDPLVYREPDREDPRVQRLRRAQRLLWLGAIIFTISAALTLGPLMWGPTSFNKYVVAFAFVGDCWGLSCIVNGGWDWLRGRLG